MKTDIILVVSCIQKKATSSTNTNGEEFDGVPEGIVLDIALVKGQRVVTVRSPMQVHT